MEKEIKKTDFTPEEIEQIEKEKGLVMYLIKTKKAVIKNNIIYIGDEDYTKITPLHKKVLISEYEDELMLVLEYIVTSQMQLETIDQMDKNYYMNLTPVKVALEVVIKKLTAPIERDYKTVYDTGGAGNEQNESIEIIKHLRNQVKLQASLRIPDKVVRAQLDLAYHLEPDAMLANAHRIINKKR